MTGVPENGRHLRMHSVAQDREKRCVPPPIILEFYNYCVTVEHCKKHISHSLNVV